MIFATRDGDGLGDDSTFQVVAEFPGAGGIGDGPSVD